MCVCTNEGKGIDAKEFCWSLSVINESQKRSRFDKEKKIKYSFVILVQFQLKRKYVYI